MKHLLLKDKKKRIKFTKFENNQILYNYLYYLPIFNNNNKAKLLYLRKNKGRAVSFVSVSNRCAISNRSKGLVTFCHISRIQFKDLVNNGFIPIIQKSSW